MKVAENVELKNNMTKFQNHECPIRIDVAEMQIFLETHRGERGLARIPALKFVGWAKALGLPFFPPITGFANGGSQKE